MKHLFCTFFFFGALMAKTEAPPPPPEAPPPPLPEGGSIDVGGVYAWIDFSTPPTYHGNTGGVVAKLTYQSPAHFFAQIRSIYDLGPLSSSTNTSDFSEWYTEILGGWCYRLMKNWSMTPYGGLGLDFIHDDRSAYSTFKEIDLRYNIFYALAGLDTHYIWTNWMLGLQGEALFTFNQYLKIKTLGGQAWTLDNRIGASVRLPVAVRCVKNFWIELAPFYRYLPIGKSSVLSLPHRNLNEVGAFLTIRYFL
jgi:hypothetical protein